MSCELVDSPRTSDTHSETKEVHIDPKRYKTKMCRNFMKDESCPYETRCMFAHGPKELRTPDENLRDGLVTESAIKKHQQQLMYEARTSSKAAATAASSTTTAPLAITAPETCDEGMAGGCTCPDCSTMQAHVPPQYAPYYSAPYTSYDYRMPPGGYCACPDCATYGYYSHYAPPPMVDDYVYAP